MKEFNNNHQNDTKRKSNKSSWGKETRRRNKQKQKPTETEIYCVAKSPK